jgi:hypothetical protein
LSRAGDYNVCIQWRDNLNGGAGWHNTTNAGFTIPGTWIRGFYDADTAEVTFEFGYDDEAEFIDDVDMLPENTMAHTLNTGDADTILAGVALTSHRGGSPVNATFTSIDVGDTGPLPVNRHIGDANCDDTINIVDAIYILSYFFSEGESCCLTNMDVNSVNVVTLVDAVGVLLYFFSNGSLIDPEGGEIAVPGCAPYDPEGLDDAVKACDAPCTL